MDRRHNINRPFYACIAAFVLCMAVPARGQTKETFKPLLDSPSVGSLLQTLVAADFATVSRTVTELRALGNNPRLADRNVLLGLANVIDAIYSNEHKLVTLPKGEIARQKERIIQWERAAAEWKKPNLLTKKPNPVNESNALRNADGCRKEIERINAGIRQFQPVLVQALRAADTAAVHYRQADCLGTTITLATCIHLINDRSVEHGAYRPTFSKRWIELKSMTPAELERAQDEARAQLVLFLVGRFKLRQTETSSATGTLIKAAAEMWMEKKLDDALFTIFIDIQDVHQRHLREFLVEIAEEGLSVQTASALGDRDKVTERLRSIDPAIVNLPAVVNAVFGMLREAVRQGTPGK
jgi:hypothetical protein